MSSAQRLAAALMATLSLTVSLQPALSADRDPVVAEENASAQSSSAEKMPPKAPTVEKTGTWQSVDARMVRIERRLTDALSSGRLTVADADRIRKELDRVAEMEAIFRALPSTTTMWHIVALDYELDRVTDALERSMHDRTLVSVDLTFAKEDNLARIETAAKEGRLTAEEVQDLKAEYNRICAEEEALLKKHGKLSYADKLALCIDFDHLGARVRRQMSERQIIMPDVERVAYSLEKRLEDAVGGNQIKEEAAKTIRAQIQEIRETAKTNQELSKPLPTREAIALGLWLELLSNKIDEQILASKKLLPTVQDRLKQLDEQMADALYQGKLTPLEAYELGEDLDRIREEIKDRTFNSNEEHALHTAIARLEGVAERQTHAPSRLWSGIPFYQAHLDVRITDGQKAGRLNAEQAVQLKAESGTIAKSLAESKSQEGLSTREALQVARRLQQLSARIDKALDDRNLDVPDTAALARALDRRLGDGVVLGDLSTEEGARFKGTLEDILKMKSEDEQSGGKLTSREALFAAYELERLSLDIEDQVHNHLALFPGMSVRRAQLEEQINQAVSSGQLSDEEAAGYTEALKQSIEREKQLRAEGTGLTAEQGLELVSALDGQYLRLERTVRERQLPTAELVSLEGELERKIAHGFCLGLLTLPESDVFRHQYDQLSAQMKHLRASDGGLSYGERLGLAFSAKKLAAAVERQLRSVPLPVPNLDMRRHDLEQSVANALSTGRLPTRDALELKAKVDAIASESLKSRITGGGMSYQEALVSVIDVDRLSHELASRIEQVKDPLPNIDERQAALEKQVQEAKSAGKITPDEFNSLNQMLSSIAESEKAFRISDEALNFFETTSLILDLEEVGRRLEQMKQSPAQTSPAGKQSAQKPARVKRDKG